MGDNPALSLPGGSRAGNSKEDAVGFAGAIYWHHRGQASEDLRKMNPSLLSTAFSHLWK
jgi:hypothetical protein